MDIKDFFASCGRVGLGFSGGADSAYLLYAAVKCGADIRPYYVKTQFQPQFELDDALKLCDELNVQLKVIPLDILDENIASNPADRCYYCKKRIFSAICRQAELDGCCVIIDGTNASDEVSDRPGMRALGELCIRSPLRECGVTKAELRALSRKAGLFTWDKPAYACLATRIPTGEIITQDKLCLIENAENELFAMGFTDFRVRTNSGRAILQFRAAQLDSARTHFDGIMRRLSPYYSDITIDPKGR